MPPGRVAVVLLGVALAAERIWSLTERGSRATSGARHLDDRVDQAPCLTLVTNAAVLWTTTYLGNALDGPRRT
jgi:TnpA family transposase